MKLTYKKFNDIYPDSSAFITKVLKPIRDEYGAIIPDWIADGKMYFNQIQLYNLLKRQYGRRYFSYFDDGEINDYVINHTYEILPEIHIKNKAVLETALTKLFDSDNWGEQVKNITKSSAQENNNLKRNNTTKTDTTTETTNNTTGKIDASGSSNVNETKQVDNNTETQNITSSQQQSLGNTIDWSNMVGDEAILNKVKEGESTIGASKSTSTDISQTFNSGKETTTDGTTVSSLGDDAETKARIENIDINTIKNDLVNYMYKINNSTMIDNVKKLLWGYNGLFLETTPYVEGIELGNIELYIEKYINILNQDTYVIPSYREIPSNELYAKAESGEIKVGEYYHISSEYTLPLTPTAISTRANVKGDTITIHTISYCAYKDDREVQFTMVIEGTSMYITAPKNDTAFPIARIDYLSVSEPQRDQHAVNLKFMKDNGKVRTFKTGTVGQIRHLIDQAVKDGREVRLWDNATGENQMWVYNQSKTGAIQFSKGKNEVPVSDSYGLRPDYYIAIEGVL